MPTKSLDSARRPSPKQTIGPRVKIQYVLSEAHSQTIAVRAGRFDNIWRQKYILPVLVFLFIVVAFAGGMSFALRTPKSAADQNLTAPVTSPTPPGVAGNLGAAPANAAAGGLSDADLYNTPLQILQTYFANQNSDQILAQRKIQLKQFLIDHNSPLVDVSDTIAEQPHWQLILAISFAESTLGKKCYEFNCSGIGGATNIRSYKSFANWILDFNRLLDKRYNNWTLDEMCGVYVQPCTSNWLSATSQILQQLKQENIN